MGKNEIRKFRKNILDLDFSEEDADAILGKLPQDEPKKKKMRRL